MCSGFLRGFRVTFARTYSSSVQDFGADFGHPLNTARSCLWTSRATLKAAVRFSAQHRDWPSYECMSLAAEAQILCRVTTSCPSVGSHQR